MIITHGKCKKQLHFIIDSKDQLDAVLKLMEPETTYQTTNLLKNPDENQLARLNVFLEQAETGEFIDHETVKAKYAQRLKIVC